MPESPILIMKAPILVTVFPAFLREQIRENQVPGVVLHITSLTSMLLTTVGAEILADPFVKP